MPRKQKKYHYIYKTTNNITGRYYYGMHSTHDLEDGYLGSGRRLRHSINKYGKDSHTKEILEFCDSRDDLKIREAEIVNLNEIAKEDCMNLQTGGGGGLSTPEHAEKFHKAGAKAANLKMWVEDREKNSKRVSLQIKKRYEDPEYKEKILKKINWTGRSHSAETKEKMRKPKNIGIDNPSYGTCWITNGTESKKIKKGTKLPEGWRFGRNIKK